MQTLEGLDPPIPRPAYRQRVRQRLRPTGWWRRLTRRRTYHGHPALWSGLGAAAALMEKPDHETSEEEGRLLELLSILIESTRIARTASKGQTA